MQAGELRAALERDELVLHFQAKADLLTGEVRGVEALMRWHHPILGLLGPDRFIGLAERHGLTRALTGQHLADQPARRALPGRRRRPTFTGAGWRPRGSSSRSPRTS